MIAHMLHHHQQVMRRAPRREPIRRERVIVIKNITPKKNGTALALSKMLLGFLAALNLGALKLLLSFARRAPVRFWVAAGIAFVAWRIFR